MLCAAIRRGIPDIEVVDVSDDTSVVPDMSPSGLAYSRTVSDSHGKMSLFVSSSSNSRERLVEWDRLLTDQKIFVSRFQSILMDLFKNSEEIYATKATYRRWVRKATMDLNVSMKYMETPKYYIEPCIRHTITFRATHCEDPSNCSCDTDATITEIVVLRRLFRRLVCYTPELEAELFHD
jgi:hypothetical protein